MPPHILIVEGDNQNALWLKHYFQDKGYVVSIVINSRDGIHVLNTQSISGVLVSLDDAEENRMDFLNYARTYFPDVTVYAMSQELNSESIEGSFEEGVKGFLPKPILYDRLQEVLFEFQRL